MGQIYKKKLIPPPPRDFSAWKVKKSSISLIFDPNLPHWCAARVRLWYKIQVKVAWSVSLSFECRNYSKKVRQKLAKHHFGTLSLHTEKSPVQNSVSICAHQIKIGAHKVRNWCAPIGQAVRTNWEGGHQHPKSGMEGAGNQVKPISWHHYRHA